MDPIDIETCIEAYASSDTGRLENADLYRWLVESKGVPPEVLSERKPIGEDGSLHSPAKRKIRWYQQTLKSMGVIKRVGRGVWELVEPQGKNLHKAPDAVKVVAFSTELGVAIWGSNRHVFAGLNEAVALCISSPPFPLRVGRGYGNPNEQDYSDFIVRSLEPIVKSLKPGGSIVLNCSNDIFETGSPARSMYLERMILALHHELGLSLMDRIPWVNRSKPPGPTWWACVNKVQLSSAYEHILWFTNDPHNVCSDNRRVLEPHSDQHKALMDRGGAGRTAQYGDGAYRLRKHSFGNKTPGKIPRNVLERGHRCADTIAVRQIAEHLGLPAHGAMFPTSIPDFFIRFLTKPGELVIDPFGGSGKTGLSAERNARRWMLCDVILEFVRMSAELFVDFSGFWVNPGMVKACDDLSFLRAR